VLAYHESSAESELKVFDRSGNGIATPGPRALYSWPRFSPDGKSIAASLTDPKSGTEDDWSLSLAGGAAFRPAATAGLNASEYEGKFSPDGRWLTFFSYETGRPEVYVVPFPAAGSKSQVSTTGGWLPRFGGKELFYVTMSNRLMALRFTPSRRSAWTLFTPCFNSISPTFPIAPCRSTTSAPMASISQC